MPTSSQLRFRFSVGFLLLDLLLITGLGFLTYVLVGFDQLSLVGLANTYGLVSAGFLYITLLVSPLAQTFPGIPGRRWWFLSRRGLGLSSLLFAIPHSLVAFFGPMGGLPGLSFLDPYTGWAVLLGVLCLLILLVLGATANEFSVTHLGSRVWKMVHRSIYVLGTLVLIHILLIGTHFGDSHSLWTLGGLVLVSFLLWLQALRFDRWWAKKFPESARFGPAALIMFGLILSAWLWTVEPSPTQTTGNGVRWIVGHHGMVLPAPPQASEAKP